MAGCSLLRSRPALAVSDASRAGAVAYERLPDYHRSRPRRVCTTLAPPDTLLAVVGSAEGEVVADPDRLGPIRALTEAERTALGLDDLREVMVRSSIGTTTVRILVTPAEAEALRAEPDALREGSIVLGLQTQAGLMPMQHLDLPLVPVVPGSWRSQPSTQNVPAETGYGRQVWSAMQ